MRDSQGSRPAPLGRGFVQWRRGAGCTGHARGDGRRGWRWVLARGVGRCLRALGERLCRAVEPTKRRAVAGVGVALERACAEGGGCLLACWREAVGSAGCAGCGGGGEGGLGSAGSARDGGRGRGEGVDAPAALMLGAAPRPPWARCPKGAIDRRAGHTHTHTSFASACIVLLLRRNQQSSCPTAPSLQ